jgi:hypothetical protein
LMETGLPVRRGKSRTVISLVHTVIPAALAHCQSGRSIEMDVHAVSSYHGNQREHSNNIRHMKLESTGNNVHFLGVVIKYYVLSSPAFLSSTVKCLYVVYTSHRWNEDCFFRQTERPVETVCIPPWVDSFVRKK